MSDGPLKRFIREIHRRSLWKVLGIYVMASYAVLGGVDLLGNAMRLPDWFFPVALALLVVGLPVVLATAFVQEGGPGRDAGDVEVAGAPTNAPPPGGAASLFTWRNAFGGGVLAFALLGFVGTGWILFGGRLRPTSVEQSIAVLPFEDLSPEGDQQYFVQGLSEEIINALSQIADLKVSARTSTFLLAEQGSDIATVASTLGVANVLEGSVRKEGDRIRVIATLIEAESGFQLWSDTYDRELAGIFAIQDEIATNVVQALRIELLGERMLVRDGYRTESVEAHDAYLLGIHRTRTRRVEDLAVARNFFDRAIELDPGYAAAYAALANGFNNLHFYGAINLGELIEQAEPAIERALELDPSMGEAYQARASLLGFHIGDGVAAESNFLRAIDLSPNDGTAHHRYSSILYHLLGRLDEAHEVIQKALEVDPLSPSVNSDFGLLLAAEGDIDEAREHLRRALEIEPSFPNSDLYLSSIDIVAGRMAEGLRHRRTAATLDPGSPYLAAFVGLGYVELGDFGRAQQWFDHAASLFGDRPMAEFYREFIPLVVRRENADRLISLMEQMSFLDIRWRTITAIVRQAHLRTGNLTATREFYRRIWPDLLVDSPEIGPHNYHAAIDVAWLLLTEGDADRAQALLSQSLTVLRNIPSGAFFAEGLEETRNIAEVRALALQGNETEALAALRRAIDEGWRYLWWMAETNPTLSSISDSPEFRAMMEEVRADMTEQLERVREMEMNGELEPTPSLVANP